ncbi:phosphatidylinositol N-acetylglucosaminyltransferase subunit C [Stachybotrys elegans]|uniref:Phosphatidylinositol N-acetylglucosaminyltransferase subunit C n=1 Tax=Stachybotrys elegans TaxID=80388 RepID=A0A8K0SPS3_9HYPO|nr:phosphatidylinositol N-acetylglucosaminyltransferase subunit C [Stachybotrys elegans]
MPSPTESESLLPGSFGAFERSHLSPDDAFAAPSRHAYKGDATPESRPRLSDRSRSRRRKRAFKKLMWVKQSYPDNYTDQATFLDNLQRNPRLKPYDFWPLVADSTVILQHVCSVIIFVVCFVGIFQERVSPFSVLSWGSFGTFLGWLLWERWVAEEEAAVELAKGSANGIGRSGSLRRRGRAGSIRRPPPLQPESSTLDVTTASSLNPSGPPSTVPSTSPSVAPSAASSTISLHIQHPTSPPTNPPINLQVTSKSSHATSTTSLASQSSLNNAPLQVPRIVYQDMSDTTTPTPPEESRTHQRMGTIKSALLIYFTLLGLSPILKSLTKSTSSDSIWAMSFWLLAINIFFFDYSGGVGAKFPASLSTNAALMASTVLASRLPSTNQVFSLTLFSIEVFGLFPVFRRHVRHRSWKYHMLLSVLLVLGAGWGVGVVMGDADAGKWPWRSGLLGMVVGALIATLATGGCSWWLIGLQKYKNEIRGPWDPARPIIMSRPRWDDR